MASWFACWSHETAGSHNKNWKGSQKAVRFWDVPSTGGYARDAILRAAATRAPHTATTKKRPLPSA